MQILKSFFKRLIPLFLSLTTLSLVIYYVEPPRDYTWINASNTQILIFFIPLLLTFTFAANLYLKYLPYSFIIGLGLMLLAAFQSLQAINITSVVLIVALTAICLKLFPKMRYRFPKRLKGLTSNQKIPKLRLKQQEQ